MKLDRRQVMLTATAISLLGLHCTGAAQRALTYPSRPIRLLYSSSPGGLLDIAARLVGDRISAAEGQRHFAEAKPGANGLVAAMALASAPPDGHTLLVTNSGVVQTTLVQPAGPFQLASLQPVFLLGMVGAAIGVHESVPVRTMGELIALVKGNPNKFSYGSTGLGSGGHLTGLMLNKVTGMDMTHLAYKGEPPGLQDLIAGQIPVSIATPAGMARARQTGKVRVLAVSARQRVGALPDVPTFAELGIDDKAMLEGWVAVFAPGGTPEDIITQLSSDLVKAGATPEYAMKMSELGFESTPMGSTEFAAFLKKDVEKWKTVLRETGYQHQ
jgi:tripartite-type tricarboxylate transporter receptor subunit TctC